MLGHRCSKNGVASLAYVPGIHACLRGKQDVDGRDKHAHLSARNPTTTGFL
jgi:hypothetical protein